MAAEFNILLNLGIILLSALTLGLLLVRFRFPMIVGYLVAGMLIGPFGLQLMTDTGIVDFVAPVGIVLLLFLLGLELDPTQLRRIGLQVIVITLVETTVSLISGVFIGFFLNLGLVNSVFLGAILAVSSTAIVGKMLFDVKKLGTREGHLLVGILIAEDLLAVFFLLSLPTFAAFGTVQLTDVIILALKGIGLFTVILVFGIFAAPRLINFVGKNETDTGELGFLLSLGLGVFFAVVAAWLGFSPAIGAFLMGLTIVGKQSQFVSRHLTPIKDFFIILFFVSMGLLIDASSLFQLGFLIVPVMIVAVLGKYFGVVIGIKAIRLNVDSRSIGLTMMPRGEFSFLIARTGAELGVINPLFFPIAGAVTLVTAVVGPFALKLHNKPSQNANPGSPA